MEVEKEPTGKEENFWGNSRNIIPRELAEQGEIEAAVGVDLRDAAESENVGAGLAHPGGVWRVSSEFECEVGFHRCVDLARAADENIPAAVSGLSAANVVGALGLENLVHATPPVHVEDGVGTESRIDQQLTFPVSVVFLDRKEEVL